MEDFQKYGTDSVSFFFFFFLPGENICRYSLTKRSYFSVEKVIKSISTSRRSFLPCTNTPAFLILFLLFLFYRFFNFSKYNFCRCVTSELSVFYFCSTHLFSFPSFSVRGQTLLATYWTHHWNFFHLSSLLCMQSILFPISIRVRLLCTRYQRGTCWTFYVFVMLLSIWRASQGM